MSITTHQLFQHLATNIVKSIDDPLWETAYIEVFISNKASKTTSSVAGYFKPNDPTDHDFSIGPEFKLIETSFNLYELSKANPSDKPFNKYKFTLNNDGTFNIEFKYDQDYEYIFSIHPDSEEYDSIEVEDMRAIKSWKGLPENHPRPWLQQ
ncbi:hypothetical protein KO528_15535 [Saccharophagus degradans]|uniref:hypothetical protein n=1 Tax=Saccharophagus degradans TaxID=86304 RepID=UPI001C0A4972|nr:hypothetical protein [Saccharophagus degradans]MBU2986776.1 hypothetical protein [Saccharophagus degradans]